MLIEDMQKMTVKGKEMCSNQKDYLSWEDMQWTHKGHTFLEIWASKNICGTKPSVDIFSSVEFDGIIGCANYCEKLYSRMPSLVTPEEWENLQAFFLVWDKGLDGSLYFYLSLTDVKNKRNWTDYYTGQPMEHKGDFGRNCPGRIIGLSGR